MTSRRFRPSVGEIIEVEPEYVSKSGNLKGNNPTSFGGDWVQIKKANLNGILPDEIRRALRGNEVPFRIREVDRSHPARIVEVANGTLTVEYIPEEELPVNDESESLFERRDRDEPVDGEWDGTPQSSTDQAKKRAETFNEGDQRGSKNDLL